MLIILPRAKLVSFTVHLKSVSLKLLQYSCLVNGQWENHQDIGVGANFNDITLNIHFFMTWVIKAWKTEQTLQDTFISSVLYDIIHHYILNVAFNKQAMQTSASLLMMRHLHSSENMWFDGRSNNGKHIFCLAPDDISLEIYNSQ